MVVLTDHDSCLLFGQKRHDLLVSKLFTTQGKFLYKPVNKIFPQGYYHSLINTVKGNTSPM
jgi:hypothetical protein